MLVSYLLLQATGTPHLRHLWEKVQNPWQCHMRDKETAHLPINFHSFRLKAALKDINIQALRPPYPWPEDIPATRILFKKHVSVFKKQQSVFMGLLMLRHVGKLLTISARHTIVLRLYDVYFWLFILESDPYYSLSPNTTCAGIPQTLILDRKAFLLYGHLPSKYPE